MNKDRFKFRVWDKFMQGYVKENLGEKYVWIEDDGQLGAGIDDDSCVLEQCTGLKDKNGNLIYEGDIVLAKHSHKSRPEKFIVKWGQGVFHIITAGFWLFNFSPITLETAKKGDDFPESSEIEIIGNIHEQKDSK